jgi:hypothetical protein
MNLKLVKHYFMKERYSLHKISSFDDFGFSPDDYSRFKFGDGAVAKGFGEDLADGFITQHLAQHLPTEQLVVVPSPYSFIPTATFAMKDAFVARLNRWLVDQGLPVVQEAKIYRSITYKDDYGELDAEQRMSLIGNDQFHVDKNYLKGKMALYLDDIRITGSHERMINKMIAEYQMDSPYYMLYFAELVNHEVHPRIENFLNYHYVQSISQVDEIIQSGNFVFNTRVVKFLLNYEHSPFAYFLAHQSADFVNHLYDLALGNNYHNIPAYEQNLAYIRSFLQNSNKPQYHAY